MKFASSFFVFVACALSANAARQLTLDVDGPTTVNTVEDLKVTTVLTNTGDETIKVLKDPLGPLSQLPAETFNIESEGGAHPAFMGMRVKYSPKAAIAAGEYVTLAPGESIRVGHNLGHAYDFTKPGEGKYTIGAHNRLMVVGANDTVEYIDAKPSRKHISSRIAGKLRIARPSVDDIGLDKRATWIGCSSDRQSQLNSAAASAQSYANGAVSYLNGINSGTTRYTTWFGRFSSSNYNTVKSHFSLIAGRPFSSLTYDCSTCTENSWYAYVYAGETGRIYICPAFWRAANTGTDSKAGTLVHEASHWTANGGTKDHVYGQSGCKSLASSDPGRAIFNADSHEYFAENNPSLS
ncbi:peptidyl-Lys metalloendopeptidase [Coprinopsis sp. MPI-PUGE-AT-0042]|nr:peptidyl-Lys metalloendopeptidase [Coprinopsis sp. MPI-PUGE-AT-0042]